MIDQPLWQEIQVKFPKEVQDRDQGAAETLFNEGGFSHDFTFEDGVIGREFEEQMQQLRAEEELRKNKELVESEKLIKAIQLEGLDTEQPSDVVPEASDSSFIDMQRQLEAEIEQQNFIFLDITSNIIFLDCRLLNFLIFELCVSWFLFHPHQNQA